VADSEVAVEVTGGHGGVGPLEVVADREEELSCWDWD